jgi:hypothetical protein
MTKRTFVGLAMGLGVLAAGVAAALLLLGEDTTTALDADQARVAASVTTTTSSSRSTPDGGTPAEGANDEVLTYVYETVGFEEVDALTGARHDYPAATFLTIQSGGCGRILRWQAIDERWTSWDVCDSERLAIAGFDSFHEWFGIGDLQEYECADPATLLPPSVETTEWTFACTTGDRTEEITGEVIGVEVLDIGDRQIETLHVRFTAALSGESDGGRITDRWFTPDDALMVKEVGMTASASSSAIGTVNYTEEYEIVLQALDPLDE